MQSEAQRQGRSANDNPAPAQLSLPPLPSPARIQELLFDAARLGRTDVIPALLHAGAQIEATDGKGHTPLILASYHGHCEATAMLLEAGAEVDRPDRARGNTALMGVAFKGHGDTARVLLDAGADPNAINRAGQTPLMMAALFGHSAIADLLIARGADVLREDAAGNSAVSVAQAQNNEAMVRHLLATVRVGHR